MIGLLWDWFVVAPVRKGYFISLWKGAAPEDICAHLSGVSGAFWANEFAHTECTEMLTREVDAWVTIVMLAAYALFLAYALKRVTKVVTRKLNETVGIATGLLMKLKGRTNKDPQD